MGTHRDRIVLLVDDDDGVMSVLSHAMAHIGWRVLAADNAEAALAAWRAEDQGIDLLITDVHMPETHGCELAQRIRERQPAVPIVFISGDPESELSAAAQKFSNHRYLKKPFRTSELVALVSSFEG